MDIETYRELCLSFKGVTEEFPFDNKTLVFKVQNKLFALLDVETFEKVNLKCEPARALDLRETLAGVSPGYHMNKKHWNSINTSSDVSDMLLIELTKHSYDLVVSGLSKTMREQLNSL